MEGNGQKENGLYVWVANCFNLGKEWSVNAFSEGHGESGDTSGGGEAEGAGGHVGDSGAHELGSKAGVDSGEGGLHAGLDEGELGGGKSISRCGSDVPGELLGANHGAGSEHVGGLGGHHAGDSISTSGTGGATSDLILASCVFGGKQESCGAIDKRFRGNDIGSGGSNG